METWKLDERQWRQWLAILDRPVTDKPRLAALMRRESPFADPEPSR